MNVSLNELMGALAKAAIGAGWPHGPARDFAEAAACTDAPDWAAIVSMLERPAPQISGGLLTNAPAILSMPSAVDMVQATGQRVTLGGDDFAGLAAGYARARGHIAMRKEADGAVTFAPGEEGPVRPATRFELPDDIWTALNRLAVRSYVASNEQSRISGAGAGLLDND